MPITSSISGSGDCIIAEEYGGDGIDIDETSKTERKTFQHDEEGTDAQELEKETVEILLSDPHQQCVQTMRRNAPRLLRLSGLVENKNLEKMKNLWEKRPETYDETRYFGDPTNGVKVSDKWDIARKKLVPVRKKPRKEELLDMYSYLLDVCKQRYKSQLDRDENKKIQEEVSKPKQVQEKGNSRKPASLVQNVKQVQDMRNGCYQRLQNMKGSIPDEDLKQLENNLSIVKKMVDDAKSLMELARDTCGSLHNVMNNVEKQKGLSVQEKANFKEFYERFSDCNFLNIPTGQGSVKLCEEKKEPMDLPTPDVPANKSVLNWQIKSENPQKSSCAFEAVFQPSSVEPFFVASGAPCESIIEQKKDQSVQQNVPVTVLLLNEEDEASEPVSLASPMSSESHNFNPRDSWKSMQIFSATEKELIESLSKTSLSPGLSHKDSFVNNRQTLEPVRKYVYPNSTEKNKIVMQTVSSPPHQQMLPSIEELLKYKTSETGRPTSMDTTQFEESESHMLYDEEVVLPSFTASELFDLLSDGQLKIFEEESDSDTPPSPAVSKYDVPRTSPKSSLKRHHKKEDPGIRDKKMRLEDLYGDY